MERERAMPLMLMTHCLCTIPRGLLLLLLLESAIKPSWLRETEEEEEEEI